MKKVLCSILILTIIALVCGCSRMENISDQKVEPINTSMFVLIEKGDFYKVVYHKKTKVMYTLSNSSSSTGVFTVMLNADGTPMLYESEE